MSRRELPPGWMKRMKEENAKKPVSTVKIPKPEGWVYDDTDPTLGNPGDKAMRDRGDELGKRRTGRGRRRKIKRRITRRR